MKKRSSQEIIKSAEHAWLDKFLIKEPHDEIVSKLLTLTEDMIKDLDVIKGALNV